MLRGALIAVPALLLGLSACSDDSIQITDEHRKLAKEQFRTYCMPCHGENGKGDGPMGIVLKPNPRNWTDKSWQESTTDEQMTQVIRDGGASVGLSPLMAPNPEYRENKEVIAALVEMVRGFGK